MAKGVATGIVDEGGVLVILLRCSHYFWLRRRWEPPNAAVLGGAAGTSLFSDISTRT